ncbi:hypothetical protein MRB53_037550 [Persea americana]|nr:hypothetical protein MRB53_037550 [Persea americana]
MRDMLILHVQKSCGHGRPCTLAYALCATTTLIMHYHRRNTVLVRVATLYKKRLMRTDFRYSRRWKSCIHLHDCTDFRASCEQRMKSNQRQERDSGAIAISCPAYPNRSDNNRSYNHLKGRTNGRAPISCGDKAVLARHPCQDMRIVRRSFPFVSCARSPVVKNAPSPSLLDPSPHTARHCAT